METVDLEEQLSKYGDWLELEFMSLNLPQPQALASVVPESESGDPARQRWWFVGVAAALLALVAGLVVLERQAHTDSLPSVSDVNRGTGPDTTVRPTDTSAPPTTSLSTDTASPSPTGPVVTIPDGAMAQPDEPDASLVDVRVSDNGTRLIVSFIGGTPYDPVMPCSRLYVPSVVENDNVVDIKISSFAPTARGVACVAPLTTTTLQIDLTAPLGARRVTVMGIPVTVTPDNLGSQYSPDEQIHSVVEGDTLDTVAAQYGLRPEELVAYNGWTDGIEHRLGSGETVRIPPGALTPMTRGQAPIDNLAIGDSVMLGAAGRLAERGYDVNAVTTRQLTDMVPLLRQLREAGAFGNVVVIHLGTNGPFDAQTLDAALEPLSDVPQVVLVNVFADRPWAAPNNEILKARDHPDDNITLIDWNSLATECPGDCFAPDDIHLDSDGANYYADVIGDVTGL